MFEKFEIPSELIPSDPRFGAGPSLVPTSFLENLLKSGPGILGTSHRKPAVKNMVQEIQEGLLEFFQAPKDYKVVLGNGGATLMFDMIGLGLTEKKSVHYTCGEFSQKWFKSHNMIPWIEAVEMASEYGQGCQVQETDYTDADLVCLTLNETSTGVQNCRLPLVNEDKLLCVDATSGGGQVKCDLSKTDVFFFSPQKVFASEGGLWVAIMSPKAIARAMKINANKDRYIPGIMDWKVAIDNGEKAQTYNTPSLSTLFFLREQVRLMRDCGLEAVYELAEKKAKLLYEWATEKSYLSCFVTEEEYRSRAVATIDLDDKVSADELCKFFREKKIIQDIEAYRKLGRNQLRIGFFHNVAYDDLKKITELISMAIESEL